MGRTNIVLDDELIAQAMALTGVTTKREAVDLALRRLVSRARSYRALRALRGAAAWDGDVERWRKDRVGESAQ